jgi:predicted Rossmann fold nucleotide-binding protein DprA/Smf involved in DNA uptake
LAAAKKATVRWVETGDLMRERGLADSTELRAWKKVGVLGAVEVLRKPALGLFCSIRCPGKVILAVYDLARALRDAGIPVIGGFHTPMEKECLDLLLRGVQPIVVCPARGLDGMRLPAALKNGVESGRLTLLSPFGAHQRRAKADLAEERNRFVAAFATEVFVAYAAPEGKTEELCRLLMAGGKSVLTLDLRENARLLELGAKPVLVEDLARRWAVEVG